MIAFMKMYNKSLLVTDLERWAYFNPENMAQNCQNGKTALNNRAVCTGKKLSYLCNSLSERDLSYIFVNAIISAS